MIARDRFMLRAPACTSRLAVAGALLSVAAQAGAQVPLATGEDAEITEDGLHRVAVSAMESAWVRSDLDLSRYEQIFLMPTGVSFRAVDDQGNRAGRRIEQTVFAVPDELRLELRTEFARAFTDELSAVADYPVSTVPGRYVLMAQGFLVDVAANVPPDEAGVEFVQDLRWDATIVLELKDSMSDEVLARTVDSERVQEIVDSDFVREQVRQLARRWANLLRRRFDELAAIEP